MITILYDTQNERDHLIAFFNYDSFCYDFSDMCNDCFNSDTPCKDCRDRLIDNCIQDRAEYQKVNPFLKNQPESCKTCANAPICWLATTAAAPAPCAHYIPEVSRNEG